MKPSTNESRQDFYSLVVGLIFGFAVIYFA